MNLLTAASKWHSNEYDISSVNIEGFDGFYQYFFDAADSTLYGHIAYTMENLSENSNIEVGAIITNTANNYNFTFDEGVDTDSDGNFLINSAFSDVSFNGQEIYFAIEFKNKTDKKLRNNASIYLSIDKTAYPVYSNITLDFIPEQNDDTATSKAITKPSTTKKQTTTNRKAEKITKEKTTETTKFKYSANSKFKPQISTSEKFKYNGTTERYAKEAGTFGEGEVIAESGTTAAKSYDLSKIILAAVGLSMIIIGFALIIKRQNDTDKKDDKNTDE